MDGDSFDLVVIGSGPAGEKGAAVAAYHGRRVAVVERSHTPGGAAVATGGIPTKALRETALRLDRSRRDHADGLTVTLDRDAVFELLRVRAGSVSLVMSQAVSDNIERQGIELIHGEARLGPDHQVVVSGDAGRRVLRAEVVLLATGSRPVRPASLPFDGRTVVDSNEILALDRSFDSLVVVGAGPVGCEYASMFAAIGIRVWLIEAADRFLPLLDVEVAGLLAASLRDRGVDLMLGTTVARAGRGAHGLDIELSDRRVLRPERLLFAGGRASNTEGLGLEEAGVAVDGRGRIVVDDQYRTTAAHVFAAGDVVGPPALASVSMEQARVAVSHAFGFPLRRAIDELMPVAVYSIPEVAAVGMSEEAARRAGLDHEVGRASFERNPRAAIAGDAHGLVKLVFERSSGRLLGVHILGDDAAELVHQGQAVIRHGGTVIELINTTYNVPTRSDAYKYAAYDGLKRVEVRSAFGDVPASPPR